MVKDDQNLLSKFFYYPLLTSLFHVKEEDKTNDEINWKEKEHLQKRILLEFWAQKLYIPNKFAMQKRMKTASGRTKSIERLSLNDFKIETYNFNIRPFLYSGKWRIIGLWKVTSIMS